MNTPHSFYSLREKIAIIWNHRAQIADGFYHAYIANEPELRAEAARRLSICQTNQCGMYDSDGTSGKLIVPGLPGCTGCGCSMDLKVNCMSCHCTLKEHEQEPLWEEVITPEQEKHLKEEQEDKKLL